MTASERRKVMISIYRAALFFGGLGLIVAFVVFCAGKAAEWW